MFGAETWVVSTPMMQRLEGAHVGFLQQVTRKKAKRLRDGYFQQVIENSHTGIGDTAAP